MTATLTPPGFEEVEKSLRTTLDQPAQSAMARNPQTGPGITGATGAEGPEGAAMGSTVAAAGLSIGAAAFMIGGAFRGVLPRPVGLLAAVLGAGTVYLALRLRRPWVQYFLLPIAVLAGALLVLPQATGQGSSSLPSLVQEALGGGGLLQPPIPFDPGWRFLLLTLMTVLAGGAASASVGLHRPRLSLAIGVPLVMAGELVQPPGGAEVASTIVAMVLLMGAMSLAWRAQQLADGVVIEPSYELRRLGRTAALMLALGLGVVGLSQTGALFPQPQQHRVIPPQRPRVPPPTADRVLFTYRQQVDRKDPIRLGTISIYDQAQGAWLLPSYDVRRLRPLANGVVPNPQRQGKGSYSVEIVVGDVGGHEIPTIANLTHISGSLGAVQFDPETQVLRLPDQRLTRGQRYRMDLPPPPTGAELAAAPAPPATLKTFIDAPAPPAAVLKLLEGAPTNSYARLQVLRAALFARVVASGAGRPVDLPVARVSEMLAGGEATPYEITAAEALLARWAGVPSRIGYGYYGGDKLADGSFEVHPRHGATWLEAYFGGLGWVPIVGTPQQARASTSDEQKNTNPNVVATDDLALVLYQPVRVPSIRAYYDLVRYYLALVAPFVLGLVGILLLIPGLVKLLRSRLRARAARRRGGLERVITAYAEFRDLASDLTYADPVATPLEYLTVLATDDEHRELAWLVTRVLWGDLGRDLQEADIAEAERLSLSVRRRLRRGHSLINVVFAFIARTSLRDPYTEGIPNPWPRHRSALGRRRFGWRPGRRKTLGMRLAAAVTLVLVLGGCGTRSDFVGPSQLRPGLVPPSLGSYEIRPEPKLTAQYVPTGKKPLVSKGE
ncbi:MAG: transglutaminase-like domain-containing protein, partial [Candidatus Dormibacteria bacterium]